MCVCLCVCVSIYIYNILFTVNLIFVVLNRVEALSITICESFFFEFVFFISKFQCKDWSVYIFNMSKFRYYRYQDFFLSQISVEAYIFIISLHLYIQKNGAFSGIGRFSIRNREVYRMKKAENKCT